MTVEFSRQVVCAKCREPFRLSARNLRGHKVRGTQPTCEGCRRPGKPRTVTQIQREFWLARFAHDEIREMALALWPDAADATTRADPRSERGVQPGDEIRAAGNRRMRLRSVIPTELAGEFVDGAVYAVLEIEPAFAVRPPAIRI
jgi:hypothetical protein